MASWKKILNADPVDWLLEETDSSVRYFTLLDILDKRPNNIVVKKAKDQIMSDGIVPHVLAQQKK